MKKRLTNEQIKKVFRSNFDLANFAIDIGRETVLAEQFTTLDELIDEIKKKAQNVEDPELKEQLGIV